MSTSPSSPLRLAVVTTHIAPAKGYGGVAESVARLVRRWGQSGHGVGLCASDASIPTPLTPDQLDFPPSVRPYLFHTPFAQRMGFGLGAIPAILRACLSGRVAYINGLTTWPTSLAKLICILTGRPMLVALRAGMMPSHLAIIKSRKPVKWALYHLVELPLLRRAAALHVTSPLEAQGLADWFPDKPVHVVPNGLDFTDWPPLPPRSPDGGLCLCYVGRFSVEKGILAFLHQWLSWRRPADRLLLAGDGTGAYAQAVRDLAATCPQGVEMLGYVDAQGVRQALACADMLILPSGMEQGDLRENFGNVVVEALACARPVLATRGMAWDMAESEGFGLTFPPNGPALAAVLDQAARLTPDDLARMGRHGRDYALAHYAIDQVAERLWAIAVSLDRA